MAAESSAALAGLVDRVVEIDEAVDKWVDRVRRPGLDPVFYGLSSAADHGLLWLSMGALRAAASASPEVALRLAAVLTAESALTNGPVKWCFRRVRPPLGLAEGALPFGMHRPVSSSFPSGHATSAFTAAVMLAGGPATPAVFAVAALVAASRVYVRLHHASDVIAGAALGLALGAIGRRLLPLHRDSGRRRGGD
jgi:undecaprenyl-diphosphatase